MTREGAPEAAARLLEAQSLFRSLGAEPLLAEVGGWLERAHAGSTTDA